MEREWSGTGRDLREPGELGFLGRQEKTLGRSHQGGREPRTCEEGVDSRKTRRGAGECCRLETALDGVRGSQEPSPSAG